MQPLMSRSVSTITTTIALVPTTPIGTTSPLTPAIRVGLEITLSMLSNFSTFLVGQKVRSIQVSVAAQLMVPRVDLEPIA